jgi:hypothetical protein
MIYIFGDSHARFNFKNLKQRHNNLSKDSITMFRVGRDGLKFIDFKYVGIGDGATVIYAFGEVDARCHVGRQVLLCNEANTIIDKLVDDYIESIKININNMNIKIIICCIVPPMDKGKYESFHGPQSHDFDLPFVGTNEERIGYTVYMNKKLKEKCEANKFIYLDFYKYYLNDNNTLDWTKSDHVVHIIDNEYILDLVNVHLE